MREVERLERERLVQEAKERENLRAREEADRAAEMQADAERARQA